MAVLGLIVIGAGACREERRKLEDDSRSAIDARSGDPNQKPGRVAGVGVDTTLNGDATRPSPSPNDVTKGGTVTPRDSGAGDSTAVRQANPRR
jgi:hypothetical protein